MPPRAVAIRGAFLPTAISFAAFQYGGELLAMIQEEDDDVE